MLCSITKNIAEMVTSERSKQSLIFDLAFDSVFSSNSRYLQNLIVSKNVRNSLAAYQCDLSIIQSFFDCSVSFSTSSVRKARSISGLCLAHDHLI